MRAPRYIRQTVQEGWKTISERVPHYVTQTVQDGWKTITERVPHYVTQTVQQGYKTVVQPVTKWVSRTVWEPLKKWIPGLGWLAEKVKKTVVEPVTRFVTKTVPNFVTRTVQAGWNVVTKTVPNFVTRTVQAGWDFVTKTVPNFVTRTVQALSAPPQEWKAAVVTAQVIKSQKDSSRNFKYTLLGGLAGMFGGGMIGYRVAGIPGAIIGGIAGGIAGAYTGNILDGYGPDPVKAWFGFGPDNRGIRFANEYYADSPDVSTTTAASIVMQHQWNQNPLENFLSRFSSSPSYGPAQISPKELNAWKASGMWNGAWDVNDPYYAAIAMSVRIQNGLDIFHQKCEKRKINCSPLDDLFVTAIVQNNGGMSLSDDQRSFDDSFSHTQGGIIQWHEYAAKPKKSKYLLNFRTWGQNYDTQFMIRQYYNDLMALHNSDPARWSLPEGISEQEMEYFRCVGQFKWPWEAKKCVRP